MSKKVMLVLSACLCLMTLQASAAVIISHNGSQNPDPNEGFTNVVNGTGYPGVPVTHLGEEAWKVTSPQGGANGSTYQATIPGAVFTDPTGWTTSWRMAAEDLKADYSDEAKVNIPGSKRLVVRYYWVDAGASSKCVWELRDVGAPDGGWHYYDVPQNADRSFAFHDFALHFDPSTGENNVYLDTSLIDTFTAQGTQPSDQLHWGGAGGNDFDARDVHSYWSLVMLETGPYTGVEQCGDLNHPYPTGDFSKDCVVGLDDLVVMVAEWLDCTDPSCD